MDAEEGLRSEVTQSQWRLGIASNAVWNRAGMMMNMMNGPTYRRPLCIVQSVLYGYLAPVQVIRV